MVGMCSALFIFWEVFSMQYPWRRKQEMSCLTPMQSNVLDMPTSVYVMLPTLRLTCSTVISIGSISICSALMSVWESFILSLVKPFTLDSFGFFFFGALLCFCLSSRRFAALLWSVDSDTFRCKRAKVLLASRYIFRILKPFNEAQVQGAGGTFPSRPTLKSGSCAPYTIKK